MSQPRTRQMLALLRKNYTATEMLGRIADGATHKQLAAEATERCGVNISGYYINRYLQGLGDAYAEAKRAKAQTLADRIASTSEDVLTGKVDPASARVSTDNWKWLASRLDKEQFGERLEVTQAVDISAQHLAALRTALRVAAADVTPAALPAPELDEGDQ